MKEVKIKMKNTITRNINDIVGRKINARTMKRETKMALISENINTSRYSFTLVNANTVSLKPRFHNKRDRKGRFASMVR
jgi:hypothetical protein